MQKFWLSSALPLVVGLSSAASGCLPQAANGNQALLANGQAELREAELRAHVAELEARLARIESHRSQSDGDGELRQKLDQLILLNRQLLSTLALTDGGDPPRTSSLGKDGVGSFSSTNDSERHQVERLLEQLRSDAPSWRGGLSREKREALRILLQPERVLDRNNPLR